uniref:Uncharacterized protein n=1 Tax=Timema bartmani TaxID=61472 RepID=A0A7R9HW01_9NEOP|nr:unnamed protein product [Timema bartmani]
MKCTRIRVEKESEKQFGGNHPQYIRPGSNRDSAVVGSAGVGWTPPLNEFIRHYEPAPYDRDALATHHRRLRRDVSSPPPPTPLRLHFAAHNSRAGKFRHTHARARALKGSLGRLSFVLDFSDIGLLLLHDPSLPYVERIQAPSDSFLVDNIEMIRFRRVRRVSSLTTRIGSNFRNFMAFGGVMHSGGLMYPTTLVKL